MEIPRSIREPGKRLGLLQGEASRDLGYPART